MYKNQLPAQQVPYQLDAGEGARYAFGNQLAIHIATPAELGQSASGTILTGARAAKFPLHRHEASHEALFVIEGVVKLLLAGRTYMLTPSDYVNIPPGTPHGYKFSDHRGKLPTTPANPPGLDPLLDPGAAELRKAVVQEKIQPFAAFGPPGR